MVCVYRFHRVFSLVSHVVLTKASTVGKTVGTLANILGMLPQISQLLVLYVHSVRGQNVLMIVIAIRVTWNPAENAYLLVAALNFLDNYYTKLLFNF